MSSPKLPSAPLMHNLWALFIFFYSVTLEANERHIQKLTFPDILVPLMKSDKQRHITKAFWKTAAADKQTQLIVSHRQPAVGLCFNERKGVLMSLLIGNLTHPPAFSSSMHVRKSLSCTAELGGILIHTVAGLNPYIWILTKLAARDIHNTLDFSLRRYITRVSPLI